MENSKKPSRKNTTRKRPDKILSLPRESNVRKNIYIIDFLYDAEVSSNFTARQ